MLQVSSRVTIAVVVTTETKMKFIELSPIVFFVAALDDCDSTIDGSQEGTTLGIIDGEIVGDCDGTVDGSLEGTTLPVGEMVRPTPGLVLVLCLEPNPNPNDIPKPIPKPNPNPNNSKPNPQKIPFLTPIIVLFGPFHYLHSMICFYLTVDGEKLIATVSNKVSKLKVIIQK